MNEDQQYRECRDAETARLRSLIDQSLLKLSPLMPVIEAIGKIDKIQTIKNKENE